MTPQRHAGWRDYLGLCCLVLAGEAIFSLPFHVPRFFKPTMLDAFGITNTALGDAFAIYGLTAMLSYVPGGWLADRLPARGLIVAALLATALGGAYLASYPGPVGLRCLYAWWGVTTILLFWAAMIRATREWGGPLRQGRAFGLLEAGRGLMAAVSASLAVLVLAHALGGLAPTSATRISALREVILFYTGITLAIAGLCAWLMPARAPHIETRPVAEIRRGTAVSIWLQAAVVVAAYCGYKGLDNYALYLVSAFGMDEVRAASFMAGAAWLRPLTALIAGVLADRLRPSSLLVAIFGVSAVAAACLGLVGPGPAFNGVLMANAITSIAMVYALRGVYFVLMEESGVPAARTGFVAGVISVLGFSPDVFFAPLAGRLLDAHAGIAGLQQYFLLLAALATCGALVAGLLARQLKS